MPWKEQRAMSLKLQFVERAVVKATHPLPYGRSVLSLIHARTAARRAAWSGMPSAFARLSRCFHTLAGKRTERGTVGPVSVASRGLPRPAWMELPSAGILSGYGVRRTVPFEDA